MRRSAHRATSAPGRRRVPTALALAIAPAFVPPLVAGCAGPPGPEPAPPPAVAPDAAEVEPLVEAHNRRVERLRRLAARGVLELRWRDAEGREHFEPQVNANLWLDLPRRTALRAEKLGDVYLWLGSDDERYWLFDMTGDRRRLVTGRHEAGADPRLLVAPLALIDLLGLTPLDPAVGLHVARDEALDAWAVTTAGAGGPMRVYLAARSAIPLRVETLDPAGRVVLAARLDRPRSVPVPGVSAAGRPRFPTLVDIADPEGTIAVKLALGEVTVDGLERVHDLERLIEHLRPEVVEDSPSTIDH